MAEHLVYVISDLHLGGAPGARASDRGFRICTQGDALAGFIEALAAQPTGPGAPRTELVINGDFVDFLAEEDEPVAWTPLKEDPERARRLFERIVERNRPVFRALARLVERGHTLTVLIGNHDIELAFPAVRQALAAALGLGAGAPLRFLHDGEAYAVGDALIEHGNRYDGFNAVDFDALRRVRSIQSRGLPVPADRRLPPPPGSQLVAEVMNPLKQHYPFIDLLKPEAEAAVPLLLALAPGARRHIARVLQRHPTLDAAAKARCMEQERVQMLSKIQRFFGLSDDGAAMLVLFRDLGLNPEIGQAPAGERKEVVNLRKQELLETAMRGRHHPRHELMDEDDGRCDGRRPQQRQQEDQHNRPCRHATGRQTRIVEGPHRRRHQQQAGRDKGCACASDLEALVEQTLANHVGYGEKAPAGQLDPPEDGQSIQPVEQQSGQRS